MKAYQDSNHHNNGPTLEWYQKRCDWYSKELDQHDRREGALRAENLKLKNDLGLYQADCNDLEQEKRSLQDDCERDCRAWERDYRKLQEENASLTAELQEAEDILKQQGFVKRKSDSMDVKHCF